MRMTAKASNTLIFCVSIADIANRQKETILVPTFRFKFGMMTNISPMLELFLNIEQSGSTGVSISRTRISQTLYR